MLFLYQLIQHFCIHKYALSYKIDCNDWFYILELLIYSAILMLLHQREKRAITSLLEYFVLFISLASMYIWEIKSLLVSVDRSESSDS